jgi:hypothetical protein
VKYSVKYHEHGGLKLEAKTKIREWLENLISEGKKIEVTSFLEEIPIKEKIKPESFDDRFIQWSSSPKLKLAAGDFGKIFTYFFDPQFKQRRLLEANVTYYNDDFLETTHFKLSSEPRLHREFLRVKVSDSKPVKAFVIGKDGKKHEVKVKDISEGGIGIVTKPGTYNYNDEVTLEVCLPKGCFKTNGIVVSKEDLGSQERVGICFGNISQRERDLICRYILDRQKEIMKRIKMLAE